MTLIREKGTNKNEVMGVLVDIRSCNGTVITSTFSTSDSHLELLRVANDSVNYMKLE